jgi:hypothetical protein
MSQRHSRISGHYAATVFAALASACSFIPQASAPSRPAVPAVVRAPTTSEKLVAYLATIRAMDEAALAAEAARSRTGMELQPGDFARVELAMVLIASPQSDEAEILAVLSPALRDTPPVDTDLRAMAGFLHAIATERRKLREGLVATNAKLKEDRREAQSQKLRADAQQERADRLQQKLEALTNLEKSLANRKNATNPNRTR